jgi:hypothetical protein
MEMGCERGFPPKILPRILSPLEPSLPPHLKPRLSSPPLLLRVRGMGGSKDKSTQYCCAFVRGGENISVRQVDDKKEKWEVPRPPEGENFFVPEFLSTCGRSPSFVALGLCLSQLVFVRLRLSPLAFVSLLAYNFGIHFSRPAALRIVSLGFLACGFSRPSVLLLLLAPILFVKSAF